VLLLGVSAARRCLALGAVGEIVIKVRRASVDAAAAVPALEVGAAMEVQGCGEDCDFACSECAWEVCRIVADHGDLCAVRITSDGELYRSAAPACASDGTGSAEAGGCGGHAAIEARACVGCACSVGRGEAQTALNRSEPGRRALLNAVEFFERRGCHVLN